MGGISEEVIQLDAQHPGEHELGDGDEVGCLGYKAYHAKKKATKTKARPAKKPIVAPKKDDPRR